MAALQGRYPQSQWLSAIQPIEDGLRVIRRDALVAFILQPVKPAQLASVKSPLLTTDDIFDYYLIDPEMCPCGQTTRLLQPSLAIQQFVQQCFLDLTINATVAQATLPAHRGANGLAAAVSSCGGPTGKSSSTRRTMSCPNFPTTPRPSSPTYRARWGRTPTPPRRRRPTELSAQALVGLEFAGRSALQTQRTPQGATYCGSLPAPTAIPHSGAIAPGPGSAPGRRLERVANAHDLDVASDQVVPVVWDQRLHLIWPILVPTSKTRGQPVPAQRGGAPAPQKFWAVEFAMSEFSAGQWQPKQTYDQRMFIIKNVETMPTAQWRPPAFMFKALQEASTFTSRSASYWGSLDSTYLLVRSVASKPERNGGPTRRTIRCIRRARFAMGSFIDTAGDDSADHAERALSSPGADAPT